MSRDQLEVLSSVRSGFQDMSSIIAGFQQRIAAELAPVVSKLIDDFKVWLTVNRRLVSVRLSQFADLAVKSITFLVFILKTLIGTINNAIIFVDRFGGTIKGLAAVSYTHLTLPTTPYV